MHKKPNVIVVLSDDQGYGDVSCHGNPWVKTPTLDRIHSESVRLVDFHTDPMCAPTRASLMTGRYSARTGVWSTLNGRYIMRPQEKTMAEYFQQGGYRTAMFGKWHLGDNYPCRPEDKGFEKAITFGGGVVGETPDYWDNDYFDDTYLVDGEWRDFHGYCTDIWFDRAMEFIDTCGEKPFFTYIANNAPHGPFNIHTKYVDTSDDNVPEDRARFYGMIKNIDENMERLDLYLEEKGLKDNTLLIYMGDNGTSTSCTLDSKGFVKEGYNAGFRGKKCDAYEGGHRNLCFLRWPKGNWQGGISIKGLSLVMDILPTLQDLCNLPGETAPDFDGNSLVEVIEESLKPGKPASNFSDRTVIVHNMQLDTPRKYKDFAVMTNLWRLVRTEQWSQEKAELFSVDDAGQKNDLSEKRPEIVKELTESYEKWWQDLLPVFQETSLIHIGNQLEPLTVLTCHSWHGSIEMTYNQTHVREGIQDRGYWDLYVERPGLYSIELRRWPRESGAPLTASIPGIINKPFVHDRPEGLAYDIVKAELILNDLSVTADVCPDQESVFFESLLESGSLVLEGIFHCLDGNSIGSYYAYISPLD